MSIDLKKPDCHQDTKAVKFGLCDNGKKGWAYLEEDENLPWICSVQNPKSFNVDFTAIDKCVRILREDGNEESSCDCMLEYVENIIFIELKEKTKSWMEEGINQIINTLERFPTETLEMYKHKRAYVANRKHPNFHVIDVEIKQRIFQKFRVRINVEADFTL